MPPVAAEYPRLRYHQSGRVLTVKSPEDEPKGEGWQGSPWPAKANPLSDLNVNAMPPDAAISHMKDRVSELEQKIRDRQAEMEFHKNKFNRAYGDQAEELAKAKGRILELEGAAKSGEAEAPNPKKGK